MLDDVSCDSGIFPTPCLNVSTKTADTANSQGLLPRRQHDYVDAFVEQFHAGIWQRDLPLRSHHALNGTVGQITCFILVSHGLIE